MAYSSRRRTPAATVAGFRRRSRAEMRKLGRLGSWLRLSDPAIHVRPPRFVTHPFAIRAVVAERPPTVSGASACTRGSGRDQAAVAARVMWSTSEVSGTPSTVPGREFGMTTFSGWVLGQLGSRIAHAVGIVAVVLPIGNVNPYQLAQ